MDQRVLSLLVCFDSKSEMEILFIKTIEYVLSCIAGSTPCCTGLSFFGISPIPFLILKKLLPNVHLQWIGKPKHIGTRFLVEDAILVLKGFIITIEL